ncbi:MAG: CHRD domain-containing protein [Chitinophagales bacterium]|jgi:hypothetical protein|nr:CHRD domain-containing protein [Bacteroidota bacterium]MBK9556385.1 CHRD domain-containing protein [Bacteroidota bacterium]MBL0280771.1 CHRD domain-containing protein [Bacteroidota bacterium]MBP8249258.1 CHRD domain-containing protein [Chitinophagales bacterium]MBP9878976.1 CHRD domain-containing protein [Chitinophagales bacterium]
MKKILLLLLMNYAFSAFAIHFTEHILFTAKLGGAEMVPPVVGQASGVSAFTLNPTRDSIAVNACFNQLSSAITQVAIYRGEAGANGSMVLDLSANVGNNVLNTLLTDDFLENNLAYLFDESLYIQVATDLHPDGELRGQILLEADQHFITDLTGENVVPELFTTAYGLGSFWLSSTNKKINFSIICQELSGLITSATIHSGASGVNGEMILDLSGFINGNVIKGEILPSAEFLNELQSGDVYLSIQTADNPSGELRAQLTRQIGLSFDAFADGIQMVPDVVTTGLGICVIRLSPGLDSLYYDVVVDDINSNIDYAHLHIGDYGLTYGALQVDFSPSISGHRIHGFKTGAGLSAATINKLLVSNLTLIVHTVDFPGGEIRGQVVRFARKGYTFNLEGEQVVPPVITSAYGSGILSVDRNDQNAHLMLAGGNLDQMASQVLINYEVAGQNGPMIFDLSAAMEINATDVSVDTYWDNDFTPAFDTNISGSLNNDSVYIDVRNETFAGGEIRGQIQAGFRLYNPTTAIQQFGSSNSTFVVAPNPVINQVTIQCPDQMEEAMELKITNIAGAIVFSQIIPANQSGQNLVLDANNFISGIYLIKISDSDTLYTAKFIKQ